MKRERNSSNLTLVTIDSKILKIVEKNLSDLMMDSLMLGGRIGVNFSKKFDA